MPAQRTRIALTDGEITSAGRSPAALWGGTASGLLATLSLVGALGVTAVVVAPRYISAGTALPEVVAARTTEHQALIDGLGALIGRSAAVLAIHQRGPTPFQEIVLWLHDDEEPGVIDESELAVLSHSVVLRAITVYRLADDEKPDAAEVSLDDGELATSAFCDRWRADPRVVPIVLITGVSDIRVEPVGSPLQGTQPLRIVLSWAHDSADGSDEASVVVDAALAPGIGP